MFSIEIFPVFRGTAHTSKAAGDFMSVGGNHFEELLLRNHGNAELAGLL